MPAGWREGDDAGPPKGVPSGPPGLAFASLRLARRSDPAATERRAMDGEERGMSADDFDSSQLPPEGFRVTATTGEVPVAALEDAERRIYGVQFHPEVVHTHGGQEMLKSFLYDVCGCRPNWTMTSIIESSVEAIRAQVGNEKVICGLSGGVDSAVAAALVHKAIGDQLTCVYVDTGPMRAG